MRVNYVIVFVSDMERSVRFYGDVVGMPLKFQSAEWTEFLTDGATFALHKTGAINREADSVSGECRPGLQVPDLDVFHERMLSHGVESVQLPTLVFGSRVAQYRDPDGLTFSVGEEPTPS
jgi:lactoylglutathione lyase